MPAIDSIGGYKFYFYSKKTEIEFWRHGMSTLITERDVFAESVQFSEDSMTVRLDDGRALSIPLTWYPRLQHGTAQERQRFELIGDGEGIHWPDLDEDISVEDLFSGRRSAESDASLSRWLQKRKS
jgi:hypothetical protein